ncbi:MAG: inorganic diphosphatase [Bacteroidota bacterium]
MTYWDILEEFIRLNDIKVDREKGSAHPKFKNLIYPVDYGFIRNTKSMDGGGIDIFVGEEKEKTINGVICTADREKSDSEIKVVYGCSEIEIAVILTFLNSTDFMKALFISR